MEETETQTFPPMVERPTMPITKLWVPHVKGMIAFAHPSTGPDNYRNVGAEILRMGQQVPTGDETASLVHAAYCIPKVENEPEFQNIREIMVRNGFWIFNRNLWTSEGVYVVPDLEAIGRSQPLDIGELERALKDGNDFNGIRFSPDRVVRFAPKDSYKIGEHTPESLAKDGFVVANYDFEGAEKLGEVSKKFKYNPRTWGSNVQEGQNPELRVAGLVSDYFGRLGVGAGDSEGDGGGWSFGVLKGAEGTAPEKLYTEQQIQGAIARTGLLNGSLGDALLRELKMGEQK